MDNFSKNSFPQKVDDRPIWDLLSGTVGYPAILYKEEKTSPLAVASLDFEMLLWVKREEFACKFY